MYCTDQRESEKRIGAGGEDRQRIVQIDRQRGEGRFFSAALAMHAQEVGAFSRNQETSIYTGRYRRGVE